MDFCILGPLEVLAEGREVALGGAKQRALLGVLLLHANETLSTGRLIDELWAERPPATAAKTVQVHVSRLRKALAGESGDAGADLLVTRERGYQLKVDPERLDAHRFERLLGEARDELAAGRPEPALTAVEAALALWRGEPLADLSYEPFAQGEIARLADLRVAALELLVEAKLALGGHAEVIGQLEALVGEFPYREALHAQLMLALYRADRQADALQAYQNARRKLVEELGIEPGERLRDLERAILAQDQALALPAVETRPPPLDSPASSAVAPPSDTSASSAAPPPSDTSAPPAVPPPPDSATLPAERADAAAASAPPEPTGGRAARRLVSIVFADIVGSTGLGERLDPESMHGLLDRYTEVCGGVIEKHGGSVEGFIGDAVVGVFGLTELHEDDALRAVRAAVELREEGAALSAELERERGVGIGMKLGVDSGEVFVSGGARRSSFAAGDAFNVAARLEGAAAEGQILLGDNVYRLVQGAVRAERLEPLALKGRTAKVQAWRLLGLKADESAPLTSSEIGLVGRTHELGELRAAFARAADQRICEAVTIVGPAGIGKSRLVRELIAEVGDEATVAVGRCASYGEGVTYRPLAEIVRQLGGDSPEERVHELLEGDEPIARLVLGAIGLSDHAVQPDETFWAVRVLLERVARERPLLLIVDDVHWAEPTLLELLDYLVAFSSGHPILLVCNARPEFVETRPTWAVPQSNRSLLTLAALSDAEARQLVEGAGAAGGSPTAARIVETAEGNPLFLEQLVAVGAENGGAALPSSIHAVLATRIDQLEPGERAVLEYASVQGRSFYVDAVAELLPESERARIASDLVALVRKQLLRSDRSDLPGQDAFRFAHALIREAAYQGLPKQRRAEVHEHLAGWLDGWPGQDENVGHHLGEAYRQLAELGLAGAREQALAATAAARLADAADAALVRGDPPTGARLLERAESLMEPDDPARAALLPRLGAALLEAGRVADADRVLAGAIEHAADDPRLAARARVELQLVRLQAGSDAPIEDTGQIVDGALGVLEALDDELGQCRALCLRARHEWVEGRSAQADESWRRAARHARSAGDEAALVEILDWRAAAALYGPTPVPAAIERCREILDQVGGNPVAAARTFHPMAALHAMAGDFDEARRLVRAGDEILAEVGGMQAAVIAQQEALVEMLAGRPAAAEASLRVGCERLEAMGEKALLASTAAMLAQALHAQARPEEAAEACRLSEECAAEDDLSAQVGWRAMRAKLLAAEGRSKEGERLATEAVRLAGGTDFLTVHAEALLDLGVVLRDGGDSDGADAAIRAALDLYERKGDAVSAEGARSRLESVARR